MGEEPSDLARNERGSTPEVSGREKWPVLGQVEGVLVIFHAVR
jgi:hypothetical protein